jgi:hypothetical protein
MRRDPRGSRGSFGLHRTVLLLAATHLILDGYGNILAPLLPLLVMNLNLSYFAAGTLQMCFHLASSVGWQFVLVLAAGGFLLQSTLPVNVTLGQTWPGRSRRPARAAGVGHPLSRFSPVLHLL